LDTIWSRLGKREKGNRKEEKGKRLLGETLFNLADFFWNLEFDLLGFGICFLEFDYLEFII